MRIRTAKVPWVILALMAGGAILRIAHLFSIPFDAPFHLGGLFYEFSRQIIQNHFAMPETIPYYSLGGIPFAYPPLGFYLQAIVMKLFAPPIFVTVNLLPPLIAAFTLPAFYWMIRAQTDDNRLRAAALFAFALMPSAFVNQIEGAGLAEACGTLVLLLYLGWLFRFEKDPRPVPALWAGLFLGLSILSSPGSAYGGVIISILFFFKLLRQDLNRHSFNSSAWLLLTGLTGLLVSAPYWLTIIRYHEFGGFTTTFLSQQDASSLLNQIRFLITFKPADMITFVSDEGIYGFLFDWLIFAGLIWAVLNKQAFQVLIFFAVWLIPREGSWLVAIPATWLAASGIVHLVWPLLQKTFSSSGANNRPPLAPGLLGLILVLLLVAGALNALYDLQNQPELQISTAATETLRQEQSIIPVDAHVLIAGNAALREWAPALLEREVLNCEFGLEWQPDELKQVDLINQALYSNDLGTAMAVVQGYSGDSHLWLIGVPEQVAKLAAEAGPTIEISIQDQTPELVFVIIQTK
jgi:4-amino-4-deoxy-L-arabinose transferase-like glycosyltransferase